MKRFRVKVYLASGSVGYVDVPGDSAHEAGCAALDRTPGAFCAEAVREIEADEPAILQRQAS